MPSLAEIQNAMRNAVLGGDSTAVAAWVDGAGLDPSQRVAIHRNNTTVGLIESLEANFPVVRALVGEAFFTQVARAFVRSNPPTHPVLAGYGDGFAEFLATCQSAAGLPYLPDVARLERAHLAAATAADVHPVSYDALRTIAPHVFPLARCRVHPSFRGVVSSWPVDRIWAMHQPDWPEGETVSLDDDPATVLICRPFQIVRMVRVDQGTLALLSALQRGQTLETAASAANAQAVSGFDLTATLGTVLSLGLLTEVTVPSDGGNDTTSETISEGDRQPISYATPIDRESLLP